MIERTNKPSSLTNVYPPHQLADKETPQTSRYKAIAELLLKTRSSCERVGDDSLLCIVDAAYRICQACCCVLDEVEWHQLAYSIAHQRQHQLIQELSGIIELISAHKKGYRESEPYFPNFTNFDQSQAENILPAEYEGLVQSIKVLLGTLPNSETMPPQNELPPDDNNVKTAETVSLMTNNQIEDAAECQLDEITEINVVTTDQLLLADDDTAMTSDQFVNEADEDTETISQLAVEGSNNRIISPPSLVIYFLSPFSVLLDEQPVVGWPNCKGKSIFKYLVTHRERPISKEVLMETFWPEVDPDSARNNLNVSIYGLRKALGRVNPDFPYVLFQDAAYLINPDLRIWVDAEAFMEHVRKAKECERRGDQAAAIHEYRAAETIYQSEFLVEDRYEDWLIGARQNFQDTYLTVMNRLSCYYFDQQDYEACVTICAKTLADDACNEELHQRLMRCYSLMGYTHLALRQFHVCRETLIKELSLSPSKETMNLFEQIRQRQSV